jgi:hypothetical protein
MKIKRQEFILEDHMELVPEVSEKRKQVRSKKRKAMPKVTRLSGTVTFKALQNEKYLIESYHYKKEGIKITRIYEKGVEISDAYYQSTINKFLKQKIEVINA